MPEPKAVRPKLPRLGGRIITTNLGADATMHLDLLRSVLSKRNGRPVSQREVIERALAILAVSVGSRP